MKQSALSTHVLDTANGIPAEGMTVELWRMDPSPELVVRGVTNGDGRTDGLLLPPERFVEGRYELRFAVGAYFAARGEGAGYLDVVALNVGLRAGQGHYHVPLLCSPWSYSTYRGS
ncbi:hydroxyisourate hydrolase [Muricoccus radiodurans]|uniref:hydroxyisourate hydrolase n=1 Tax=Muricoccus radiodurans TaxID=2231721 RepID=UPI003CE79846